MIVLGINPGPRSTGLAAIRYTATAADLVYHSTVYRETPLDHPPLPVPLGYLERIHAVVAGIEHLDVIGVEDIAPPARVTFNAPPPLANYNTSPLMAASIVAGYCMTFGKLGHIVGVTQALGAVPLGSYPDALVAEDERRSPTWRTRTGTGHSHLRHVRAAYDVARMAWHITTATKDQIAG